MGTIERLEGTQLSFRPFEEDQDLYLNYQGRAYLIERLTDDTPQVGDSILIHDYISKTTEGGTMTEQKFKVGDKVRWDENGDTGIVTEITESQFRVLWDDQLKNHVFYGDTDGISLAKPEDDAINPSHYQLPGGVEVIQISEHLTSNGGQAVQYVARATRLDGKIKGSPVEDLQKAIWFIEREIARLEEAA